MRQQSTGSCVVTSTELSIEEMRGALPPSVRKAVTDESLVKINTTITDPDTHEHFRENLLGFAGVMKEGRFKFDNYVSAVKYVSYKLMAKSNTEAFSLTFPDKMRRFNAQGKTPKDVSSFVSAFHHSKLVTLLLEQSMTPSWIVNQDLYQKALNTQAELMIHASSEKVRTDAANSILTHLKPPETQKLEIDIGVKEDSSIAALRSATQELAEQQRKALAAGQMTAQQAAEQPVIIEGEAERVG